MSTWYQVENKDAWNTFVLSHKNGSFLQSLEFGDFHASLGKKVWYLGHGEGTLSGVCLVIKQLTKFGSFFYVPGGPLLQDNSSLESLITEVTQLARAENVSFIRFDPRVASPDLASKFVLLGLHSVKNFTQPQCTLVLNLKESFETLRSNLSDSTRYNIGWVERQGVVVKVSEDPDDFKIFEKLLQETSERSHFKLHGEADYYQKQFSSFGKSKMAKLYLAYEPENEGNEVLAAAIVITFGKTTTYLHAASSSKSPKLRAPYLMQWQMISEAKKSGSEMYDFWGVAATEDSKDPWSGVTAFKKSFGGEKVCYQTPYDLMINNRYYLDSILEKIRLIIRKWH